MTVLRQSSFPILLSLAAVSQITGAQDSPGRQSSARTAIRETFKYEQALRQIEESAPIFAAVAATPDVEIIRLPTYLVREVPDRTKRDLDLALDQQRRLGSGAVLQKNVGKRLTFEAVLPVWLDMNVQGDRVLRFDAVRLRW